MTTLLHIDASARVTRSHSRRLSRQFIEGWQARCPDAVVLRRDVGAEPPPALSEAMIGAAFTLPSERSDAMREALRVSDQLIDELELADVIVLGTPMYNYGMPAALKAWIDLVIRVGRTFAFDPANAQAPVTPLWSGKTLVVLSARGEFGYQLGGERAAMNHLDPHLATIDRFLGVSRRFLVAVEYEELKGERFAASVREAEARIAQLVAQLAS
jgi:FMN-dependent NADH-azoreductase